MADENKTIDNFSKIENPMCYCFGSDFLKPDGTIDYTKLKDELEEFQYFYAMFMFSSDGTDDISIRLMPYPTGKWILDHESAEFGKNAFKSVISSNEFKKFAKICKEKIVKAVAALQLVDKDELDRANIKKESIDRIVSNQKKIEETVKRGFASPQQK